MPDMGDVLRKREDLGPGTMSIKSHQPHPSTSSFTLREQKEFQVHLALITVINFMSGHQNMKSIHLNILLALPLQYNEKNRLNFIFICLIILSSFRLLLFTTMADILFSWY